MTVTWQQIMQGSPVGIALLDAKGTVRECNEALHAMAGPSAKGTGWKLSDVLAQEETHLLRALMERSTKDSKAAPVEVTFAREESATAMMTLVPLTGKAKGGAEEYIAYFVDTSQQKDLERRFVHSQKMQAVGQLAGGIAHDFNNLLTAMIGFCDLLLLRHAPGEQSFSDIMQIQQNANRAAGLVRQLLAFSRRQTLQPEVIDLTETLAELSHLLNRLLGEKVALKLQHASDLWNVRVDQGQLEQVIINLAVNARDAMKEKGGALAVRTKNVGVDRKFRLPAGTVAAQQEEGIAEGDYVCIEVEDTGCGIPPEILTKIFEPFFTTKGIGEGTGLGLATVCGIIQQTGGYVFVKSSKGQGTTFSIYLKRHDAPVEGIAAVARSMPAADLTGAGTVLLVEDEDPVRMFSSRALQNKGYTVLEADSGEEALRVLAEADCTVDVVVTDVMMPGMTGPALAKELEKRCPGIRVIFISGYGEDAFIEEFGERRDFHFLPKPFSLSQLAGKVKEVLG